MATGDKLRQSARCMMCGHKGALMLRITAARID